jgi:nucleotidyltransferase/DNA polymerase involved in DNA repair
MNIAKPAVQWLFLDLNAFFASCEQQEAPALRGKPVIVVQTLTDSAVAIAASYAAKAFGIKTGTIVNEARRLCPDVMPVQANHRLYTEYHERILAAVDTCLPVEKVMPIDEMACRLMGTERQVDVACTLALRVKRALREQVGECLTCSIGIAPNVFLGKVGSDLQKPDGLVVITHEDLPGILLGLDLQDIYGIGDDLARLRTRRLALRDNRGLLRRAPTSPSRCPSQHFHATETVPINWQITWHAIPLPRSNKAGSPHRTNPVQGASQAPLTIDPIAGTPVHRATILRSRNR